MSSRARALGILAAMAGPMACRSDATGLEATALELVLDTPSNVDGAIVFTVSGAPVLALESVDGRVFWAPAGPGAIRAVYAGRLAHGVVGRLLVPDAPVGARYRVSVDQVAVAGDYRLVDPVDYRIVARRR
jgi:hypothetical protein